MTTDKNRFKRKKIPKNYHIIQANSGKAKSRLAQVKHFISLLPNGFYELDYIQNYLRENIGFAKTYSVSAHYKQCKSIMTRVDGFMVHGGKST